MKGGENPEHLTQEEKEEKNKQLIVTYLLT